MSERPSTGKRFGPLRTVAWLLSLLRPFAGWTALSVLLGAGTVAAGIGLLGTSAYLIATAALHPSVAVLQVAIVGVRFFGIARAVLRYLERLMSHDVNFRLLARLRVWFYRALEPQVPGRLAAYRSGDLLARAVADIDTLENFYVRAVAPPLSAVVVVCGVSLFAGRYDLRLGWVLAGALAAAALGMPLLAGLLARAPGQDVVARRASLQHAVVDVVQGMGDLLLSGQSEAYLQRVIRAGQSLGAAQARLARAGAAANALLALLTGLALVAVLVIGIPLVGSRLDGVALAVLALVTLASFEAVTPLAPAAQYLHSSLSAAERLLEIGGDEPPFQVPVIPDAAGDGEALSQAAVGSLPLESGPRGVEVDFQNVRFGYAPDLPPALENVNLSVAAGERVALVGPSGAGKSTMLALLLRLWETERGEIRLDGKRLSAYEPEALRRSVAYAPQSSYLFAGTLRQNLMLCATQASEEAVEWAARQAGLAAWVARLPHGLETRVGERGMQISGGERQRVALARALLACRGSARLVLLDEPTAHLDAITERRFLRDLREATERRTLILVTHRLVGLEAMDRVVVMEAGRIVEQGRHEDLLGAGGLYMRLWKIQSEVI